ncbi:pre-rRNA-processing protein TSR2-like [Triticum dicoccoides]|uniref:pre-rRNA-processing protein TSR2-like n=1 Tax=Triticum dicoccoides TaxID=85692 RepID=UPI00188ECD8F|nr:pre-rRNA-processing protein TSR2-like [Triticum dicoccoides]
MSTSTSGGGSLSPQAAAALQEGIGLVFGRWTALQMAVENKWGGPDSRAKADQLAASILSLGSEFHNSKVLDETIQLGPYYYEDLEDMMFDNIYKSLNSNFADGSIGEVAEQFLIMHEECLENNFSSIEKLRNTWPQGNAVSQSRQMVPEDDDDDSSDDGDEPSMGKDEAARSDDMVIDQPKPSKPTPDADGWTVVPPRRGRGKN